MEKMSRGVYSKKGWKWPTEDEMRGLRRARDPHSAAVTFYSPRRRFNKDLITFPKFAMS
jgi:hypothetical protein